MGPFFVSGETVRRASTEIWELLEPVTRSMGYEFVGAEFGQAENGQTLRVYIDKPDSAEGVQVDDCANVSHQLSALLDVEDPIGSEYCLEVSSPGLERPLFTEAQFEQHLSQTVSVKLRQAVTTEAGHRKNFKGELVSVSDGSLEVKIDGQLFGLKISDIEQAKLVYRFS